MAKSSSRLGEKVFLVAIGMTLGHLLTLTVTGDLPRMILRRVDHRRYVPTAAGGSGSKDAISARGNTTGATKDDVGSPSQQRSSRGPRKILLDCGANVASTVQLFRETYPDGKDYIIHSFELDARLAPYFASYSNHTLHCPVAVAAKNGTITAYAESAWKPDKGLVAGSDMQWGGGAIYAKKGEVEAEKSGRRFGVRNVIPMVDLSSWIQENTAVEDYVIFKLDVEGAEYEIIDKMLKDDTFKWVDKFYGELHGWAPVPGWSSKRKADLKKTMKARGIKMFDWAGEHKRYQDIEDLHKPDIPENTPGIPGMVYSNCSRSADGPPRLALTVQVGMNRKAAHKLVETIRAHDSHMPVTLFVYGDFAQVFPDLVTKWAERYTIGIRENQPFPTGHWILQNGNIMRMSLVASVQRLRELKLRPSYYLPANLSQRVQSVAKNRGLRIIQPTTSFPPNLGTLLLEDNYYKNRDVNRTPKALRILYERISGGGILNLDSDHPDSYMISVFLMDYLFENSGFNLVSMADCLSSDGQL
ncbi:Hypp1498 [Branchiostoma lanceolatum]|uniref:Hypp1498 protein n=1 Tax=Branchiostoma lanceolatum TaxID=7740 RepID=A0A8J9ZIE4_BRALA|nr:Hypp1498 [Branchiostoma lanceolatum]